MGCSDDPAPAPGSESTGANMAQTCNAAATPVGSSVGEYFPDARVTSCDGDKVTLDSIRCNNELTWISVGAVWCGPCREEAPELQAAHERYSADGVAIVQILFQGPSSAPATTLDCSNWETQFALTLPVYADPLGDTVIGFDGGLTQTPLNIVVDRDGQVIWSQTGALDPGGVEATIQSLR